ncbi:uncharacterized protein LY79DRAFT_165078 [Colletotrichum navitas]|uniref:Uncharacterized protein n=1 Tax=Colletotrichum navitas TaxID=681940 RepID=A0AAD8Q164_9PEZI|nr:uncharacterized protein LY79DRAFT_165078 [Colletotrichum navitas]KAK1593962.1 hypothetical protein LY79DRAFT_165078 [Colletotrichum navitas]
MGDESCVHEWGICYDSTPLLFCRHAILVHLLIQIKPLQARSARGLRSVRLRPISTSAGVVRGEAAKASWKSPRTRPALYLANKAPARRTRIPSVLAPETRPPSVGVGAMDTRERAVVCQ